MRGESVGIFILWFLSTETNGHYYVLLYPGVEKFAIDLPSWPWHKTELTWHEGVCHVTLLGIRHCCKTLVICHYDAMMACCRHMACWHLPC